MYAPTIGVLATLQNCFLILCATENNYFLKVTLWPYYLHNTDNVSNENLPSKNYVNSITNAKN